MTKRRRRTTMSLRERIIQTLSREPERDWRGGLKEERAWYENTLIRTVIPNPDWSSREVQELWEELSILVREGVIGRSYIFNSAGPGDDCVGRDYFVWLKTAGNAEWSHEVEAIDHRVVEVLQSMGSGYGERFVFGHDDEVIERTDREHR